MENPASESAILKGKWQALMVPPGFTLDRGMWEEKRTDDCSSMGGALNSGGLAPTPPGEIYLQRINDFQLHEGSAKGAQESDPPIVVRDGITDHMAKTRRNPNHRKVKRSTNAKKFRASLAALKEWLKVARSTPPRAIVATLKRKLQGYWNYYCVIGNLGKTGIYSFHVKRLVFKWLNRRRASAKASRWNPSRPPGSAGKSLRHASPRSRRPNSLDKASQARYEIV
jgi:hypothetical protein